MTKQNKGGVKRKPSHATPITPKPNGNSLIIRSAESLGRMIGALQRQLEAVAARTGARELGKAAKKSRPNKPAAARKTTAKSRARKGGRKAVSGAKGA